MKSAEIRQAFVNYFTQHQHHLVKSSSLVPQNDPTLLFTNAGMVQFKETFLGQETRKYTRAVSAQRCVRAGGKHNDLENVGYTARHHTFFEMLGNFSFGDYFKREAIQYAWNFLTQVLELPAERLWVTVYKDDDEAADIWLNEIGVSSARFSRCGDEDNFWSMGDTGPCGPCSEIFYDHGPDIAGGPPGTIDADGDRYIEIWNLVFMQYNRDKNGVLHPLPKPSVDTGMGLERISAVVQGVHTNYQIDSFQHLIQAIHHLAPEINQEHPSLNVIADHIRACAFLIADGVVPGNEGRGYVLRRIIRRAVRHGHKLAIPTPFFFGLVAPLIAVMGDAYPELVDQKTHIERILLQEENQFARTLEHGLRLLNEQIAQLQDKLIPGEVAFKLYDTYGFPVDLTADIAREHNLQVDMAGFDRCMQQQRMQSQSASQFEVDYANTVPTDLSSTFQGYSCETIHSHVTALFEEGVRLPALSVGHRGAIVLQDTPFYPESGGQVGDRGQITAQSATFRVDDTQRSGQAILHYGEVLSGEFCEKTAITATVDDARRAAIRLNHTATHLLHAALKSCLGNHVQQRGSLVDAERARFDFAHFAPITAEELLQIEALVNQQIRANHPVETVLMELEDATQSGAVALFGEKYSDKVRVLTMGDFSKELCGGTHALRTGDLGLFKITAEYGVASGVRRIEMVTGSYALEFVNQYFAALQEIAYKLKAQPNNASDKLTQVLQGMKQKDKQIEQLTQKLTHQAGDALLDGVEKMGEVNLLVNCLENADPQALRTMLDQVRSTLEHAVIVLYSHDAERLNVVAGVSKALIGRVPSAAELVRHVCGRGGGRADMAQGGGAVPVDLAQKIGAIKTLILGRSA